jgi:hypothetical protein
VTAEGTGNIEYFGPITATVSCNPAFTTLTIPSTIVPLQIVPFNDLPDPTRFELDVFMVDPAIC